MAGKRSAQELFYRLHAWRVTAFFRRCGFALVDLNGEKEHDPCYLAVRPLQNLSTSGRLGAHAG